MKPLIMNRPEPMARVRIITLRDSSEKTLKTLHRIGVMHVEESKELTPVDRAAIESERKEASELLTFTNNMLSYLPGKTPKTSLEGFEVIYTKPFKEISGEVRVLYSKVNSLQESIGKLAAESEKLTQLKKYLKPLSTTAGWKLKDLNFDGEYLTARLFVLSGEAYKTAQDRLKRLFLEATVFTVENEVVLHVIAETKDRKALETQISDVGGRVLDIPDEKSTVPEFFTSCDARLGKLASEIDILKKELESKVGEDFERIYFLREALSAENERLTVLEKAAEAKYVSLVIGWVPESDIETTITGVRENIEYVFIDARKPTAEEMPPSKLDNFTAIKPFELIVKMFEIPKYGGWDPTPIVAYSFAFFFGIMLGDVIYAVATILAAKFLLRLFTDDPESEGFKLFQRLIYISSTVGLVIGLLSGTYLGNFHELLGFKSLALVKVVQTAMSTPVIFIMLSLVVGFIHVNLAHGLALISGIRQRQRDVVLNRTGLFVFQICAMPYVMRFLGINIPLLNEQTYSILGYILPVGIVLIAIASVMSMGMLGGLFWIFDVTGIFGDILSYTRLAGVGLGTYFLAFSFNLLAQIIARLLPGAAGAIIGNIAGAVIIIFGHMLSAVLGALACFIHSIRLCFVEFLNKFYEGGGSEYSPFKLKKRTSMIAGVRY